jgi:regulator of nonsense transcripts 3
LEPYQHRKTTKLTTRALVQLLHAPACAMSERRPQVLSGRTNGVSSSPGNRNNDSARSKSSGGNRSGRGRGANEKQNEASKVSRVRVISAPQLTKGQPANGNGNDAPPKPTRSKPQNEGEKLVVRRLPPGMTEAEFLSILGAVWELGKGKVDWFSYRPGKVSTDPSKPSRPARAYLHLMKKDDILALSETVRGSTWEDAKATHTNPSLIGPPSLEFSIYKKTPSNKKRTDTRQGTIDQDPEFMAFLEELANPVPLKESIDADMDDDAAKAETKVTTTPLVEYLKEKKANKGKDGKDGKSSKRGQDSGASKGKGGSKDEDGSKKRGKNDKGDKQDKPTRETVKILTKKAATEQPTTDTAKTAPASSNANNATDAPKSRRAGIAAAARILQRDLGLSPGSAHRRARQDAAKADADTKVPPSKEAARPASPAPASEPVPQQAKNSATAPAAQKSQASGRRTRGGKNGDKPAEKPKAAETSASTPSTPPVILKKKNDGGNTRYTADSQAAQEPSASKSGSSGSAAPKNSGVKSGTNQKKSAAEGGRGFVKHVNSSQGVTEALLKQALEAFGTVTSLEVDKRKGFAYVDFADHKSLAKVISSGSITVAHGAVQVLERKDKKPAAAAAAAAPAAASGNAGGSASAGPEKGGSSRGRRGRGGGKGGSSGQANAQSSAPATAPAPVPTNTG